MPAPAGPANPPPPGQGGQQVTNLHPVEELKRRWTSCGRVLQDLTSNNNIPRPRTDDGSMELCLAYHLRGTCSSTCARRASHQRPLTPTEVQRIHEYLDAHGVARL